MTELVDYVTRLEAEAKAKGKAKADEKLQSLPNTNANGNVSATRDHSKNSVVKSDELARASYSVTLNEKRVMELLISRVHSQRNDNDFQNIEITSKMFCDVFKVSRKNGYTYLLKAAHGLQNTMVWIKHADGTGERFGVVGLVKNDNVNGSITCTIAPWVIPHLINFKGHFTKYSLIHGADFKSASTWRIFELLVSWANRLTPLRGRKNIPVDELRDLLKTPDSYPFSMFKRRVLVGSQTELKNLLNINLNIEYIKPSRKVTGLVLTYYENEQKRLPL